MSETQEKTFDIKIRLTMMDYFRYYFSFFNAKRSTLIISTLSIIIIVLFSLSIISTIYVANSKGIFNWATGWDMLLDIMIIFLFSLSFIKIYRIAYKDAKTHNFLDKDIDIRITEDKFIVSPHGLNQEYLWKKMYKIHDHSYGFALFIDKKNLAFILPKRSFKSKEHIKFLKNIALKYKK